MGTRLFPRPFSENRNFCRFRAKNAIWVVKAVLFVGIIFGGMSDMFAQNSAKPDTLYAVTGWDGANRSRFLTIDPATGAGRVIGETGLSDFDALAIDSEGGIFGINDSYYGDSYVYRMDAVTGIGTFVGNIGLYRMQALAIDENDTFYAAATSGLYIFDSNFSTPTLVGPTRISITGLAFDPTDGTLWACTGNDTINNVPDGVFTIDPNSGIATLVGTTGLEGLTTTIQFDAGGNLLGIKDDGTESKLFSIDKATGAGTVIGATGVRIVKGLAFRPQKLAGPQLGISVSAIDFGKILVDSTGAQRTVTLRNRGSENLTVTGISSAAPFSLDSLPALPAVFAPGEEQSFHVSFTPTSVGAFTGAITISSNDANGSPTKITLRGEGFRLTLAERGVCYASTGKQDGASGSLLSIDPLTGKGTLIGKTGLDAVPGLAINSNGVIIGSDETSGDLYYIDAATGEAIFAASTGLGTLAGIAYDENDVLYAISFGFSLPTTLNTIDINTGAVAQIGRASRRFRGLAFNPLDGALWAAMGDDIYTVDPATGISTYIGSTGLAGNIGDIHFDAEGNLFGVIGGGREQDNELIAIDKVSGAGAVIGSSGFRSLSGLAFHPLMPPGPHIGINKKSLAFGNVMVDSTSLSQSITIASIGDQALTVTDISIPAGPFSLLDPPALPLVLTPGERQSFVVVFKPDAAGALADTITIRSNDADTSALAIPLAGTGFSPALAERGVCYAATGRTNTNAGSLLKIDPATGAGTLISATGLEGVAALAIDANGLVYATNTSSSDNLYIIDANSGKATPWIRTNITSSIQAMAFDENNLLYAATYNTLHTIDTKTGNTATVGSLTTNNISGLAFDPITGALWACRGDALYAIDLTSGAARLVGENGLNYLIAGLHFDSEGRLFAIGNDGNFSSEDALLSLDKSTGSGAIIGFTGFQGISGMAFLIEKLAGRRLAVSKTAIEFGAVVVDSTSLPETVTLRSIGSENVTISAIELPAGPFRLVSTPALPLVLAPGATHALAVELTPKAPGSVNDTLTIVSEDAENPVRKIALKGSGLGVNRAAHDIFYAVTGSSGNPSGSLLTIDPATGAATLLGATGLRYIGGLAINAGGLIYSIDTRGNMLLLLDAATGTATQIGNAPLFNLRDLVFDKNGTLYGIAYRDLYTIDPKTAEATFIASTLRNFSGLAFDPTDGTLWGVFNNSLFTIDLATGADSFVGPSFAKGNMYNIHFDADGNLFGVQNASRRNDELVAIDKITGAVTEIGKTGVTGIQGLSSRPKMLSGKHIGVSAIALDLGVTVTGETSKPKTVVIRSIGTEDLAINDISVAGGTFSLANLPALPIALSPGNTAAFEVVFTPGTADSFTNKITITSDDADDPAREITVSGKGFALNPAAVGVCYATTGSRYSTDNLLVVNPKTGSASVVGSTGITDVSGLAISSKGTIYATKSFETGLYRIDAASGAAIFTREIPVPGMHTIVFGQNDVLYGMRGNTLYTVDVYTGEARAIGITRSINGLAFDPTDGTLWAASSREIYTIDTTNALFTLVGSIGLDGAIEAIHFDSEGNLFGSHAPNNNAENELVAIDKSSGAASVIGKTGFSNVANMAFRTQELQGRQLGVSAFTIDYGVVIVDSTGAARTVTLKSIGTEDVTVSEITLTGSPFSLSNLPALPLVLAPGASATFNAAFAPTDSGAVTGAITITSDDADTSRREVALKGRGFLLRAAKPGVLYAATDSRSNDFRGSLLTIEPKSGQGRLIGASGLSGITGLAIDSKGIIYGLDNRKDALYRFDAESGAALLTAGFDNLRLDAITFDENDVLYGRSSSSLYTVNPTSGAATKISSLQRNFSGLAFDPTDGALWGAYGGEMYIVDPATGADSLVGRQNASNQIIAIHFDAEGNLFGIKDGRYYYNNDSLVAIDKTGGLSSAIGTTGFDDITGIAFHRQKPVGSHISASKTKIDFGVVLVDSVSAAITVSFRSIGTEAVTVDNIAFSGAPFSLRDLPAFPLVLAPGQAHTIRVAIAPIVAGLFTGKIVISSNDADEPVKEIPLKGEGFKLIPALPNVCYASTGQYGDNRGRLLTLNPKTGAGALIGPSGLDAVPGLAIDSRGIIYGINRNADALYRINAETGRAIFTANLEISDFRAIAFDSSDVLYGIRSNTLYKIDPKTGRTTEVGRLNNTFSGLAFDPIDGALWASQGRSSRESDAIYRIDPKTASVTLAGSTGLGGPTPALHFDAEGNLYGVNGGNNSENVLIEIDRLTAKGRVIGPTGFRDINGLAFRPSQLQGKHLSVSPSIFDAGVVIVDSTRTSEAFIFRNAGTEDVTISGMAVPVGPFSLPDPPLFPLVLRPGEADTLAVAFAPTAGGVVTRTLAITSDDLDNPTIEVTLAGDGFLLTPAQQGVCYASALDSRSLGSLYTLDLATGGGSLVGKSGYTYTPGSMAIDSRGIIWGTGSGSQNLYFIDAATGAATPALQTDHSNYSAIAFAENDVLYAASSNMLYTIDLGTGRAREIARTRLTLFNLAYDPFSGNLWTLSSRNLYIIDKKTGADSLVTEITSGRINAFHFDSEGTLYAIVNGSFYSAQDSLATIDKTNGAVAVIGSTGSSNITNLAFYHRRTLEGKHLNASVSILDFGTVVAGDSVSTPITLKSLGTEDVVVNEITLSGGPFHLSGLPNLPLTLQAGKSHTIHAAFKPIAHGSVSSGITVTSDAANDTTIIITLKGNGFVIKPAQLGVCYATTRGTYGNSTNLLAIDPATGSGRLIGSTGLSDVSGLAINAEGTIYGITSNSGGLYKIDAATGRPFLVTNIGSYNRMDAIAFDANGDLFGVYYRTLYRINLQTGSFTRVREISTSYNVVGIAFSPVDSVLWAAAGSPVNEIYTYHPKTGATTLIGRTGFNNSISGIHCDSEGNLFGILLGRSGSGSSELVVIDKSTGRGTLVGNVNYSYVNNLAFRTQRLTGPQIATNLYRTSDFGAVLLGDSTAKTITIRSIGSEDLNVTGIIVPEGAFSLENMPNLPAVLPPDSSLDFRLAFAPVDSGDDAVRLVISSNDNETPQREIRITGFGLQLNLAAGGACYASIGNSGDNRGSLITISPTSGAGTFIGASGLDNLDGLAINSKGVIYGLGGRYDDLLFVDAVTGKATFAKNTTLSSLAAIAFDENDRLFGFNRDSLYTIDLKSGKQNAIASAQRAYQGMAFNPIDSTLWAVSGNSFYKINRKTGAERLIGSTQSRNAIVDIHFDHEGNLYGVQLIGENYYDRHYALLSFDKQNGRGTVIGKVGFSGISGLAFAPFDTTATGITDGSGHHAVPETFTLAQNYPNPFNPSTKIRYGIPETGHVRVQVINVLGQLVRTLVDEQQIPRTYEVTWDGRDDSGVLQASGVYIVRFQAEAHVLTRRMLFVK